MSMRQQSFSPGHAGAGALLHDSLDQDAGASRSGTSPYTIAVPLTASIMPGTSMNTDLNCILWPDAAAAAAAAVQEAEAAADAEANEEVENLLESYFMQIDRTYNRLKTLQEFMACELAHDPCCSHVPWSQVLLRSVFRALGL